MKSIKKILVTLMCLMLISSSFALAEEKIVKEYEFQTTNPDYSSYTLDNIGTGDLKDIPETVENGFFTIKRVTDIKIKLLSEEVPEEVIFENLVEKVLPENSDEYKTEDGNVLKLLDTEWDETKREAVTGTYIIKGFNTQPEFPATKQFTVTLADGSQVTATAKLKNVEAHGQSYTKDFTVDAKFIGDSDVAYYDLEGTLIPNNPESPMFEGYEDIILNFFGMDPNQHRITSGKWLTDYIEEDGITVRYASFSGKKLAGDWIGYYEEELTENSPSPVVYTATCYYGENIDPIYNVHVTVEYGKTELRVERVVAASCSVAVAAGLIAFILAFLAKKKKKQEEEA